MTSPRKIFDDTHIFTSKYYVIRLMYTYRHTLHTPYSTDARWIRTAAAAEDLRRLTRTYDRERQDQGSSFGCTRDTWRTRPWYRTSGDFGAFENTRTHMTGGGGGDDARVGVYAKLYSHDYRTNWSSLKFAVVVTMIIIIIMVWIIFAHGVNGNVIYRGRGPRSHITDDGDARVRVIILIIVIVLPPLSLW